MIENGKELIANVFDKIHELLRKLKWELKARGTLAEQQDCHECEQDIIRTLRQLRLKYDIPYSSLKPSLNQQLGAKYAAMPPSD